MAARAVISSLLTLTTVCHMIRHKSGTSKFKLGELAYLHVGLELGRGVATGYVQKQSQRMLRRHLNTH